MGAQQTTATFTVELAPEPGLLPGTSRFDLNKSWTGGIRGDGQGVMLSAGDPRAGAAGYVALETISGSVDGRAGSFALAQFGSMRDGDQELTYEVVPGSGTDQLAGISGTMIITGTDPVHSVTFTYTLPTA